MAGREVVVVVVVAGRVVVVVVVVVGRVTVVLAGRVVAGREVLGVVVASVRPIAVDEVCDWIFEGCALFVVVVLLSELREFVWIVDPLPVDDGVLLARVS